MRNVRVPVHPHQLRPVEAYVARLAGETVEHFESNRPCMRGKSEAQAMLDVLEREWKTRPFVPPSTGNPGCDRGFFLKEDVDMWGGEKVQMGNHNLLRFLCIQNQVGRASLCVRREGGVVKNMTHREMQQLLALRPQWDPSSFGAMTCHVQPGTTNLLFHTRLCVVSGCKSALDLYSGIHNLVHMLNNLRTDVWSVSNMRFTNYVTCGYVQAGGRINLESLRRPIEQYCSPTGTFSGMFIRFPDPVATFIVFATGSVVGIGKDLIQLRQSYQHLENLMFTTRAVVAL